MANDPIHQFVVEPIFPLSPIVGHDFSFTNASAYMLLTVAVAGGFMVLAGHKKAVLPGRLQVAGEMLYKAIERECGFSRWSSRSSASSSSPT